jgi:hypothetical protein
VLDPIETAGFTLADVPDLRDRVRRLIVEQRERLKSSKQLEVRGEK